MNTKSKQRRLARYRRRVARLEQRLARIQSIEDSPARGALMTFIATVAQDMHIDLDANEDGEVTFDEIVDEIADRLDALITLTGVAELVTDLGIRAFAWAAVMIYDNRVDVLTRRLARNKAKLAALETALAA